jgi:hypothetical protein
MPIPKLLPPAHLNWFSFKNRLVTCLRFYGIDDPKSATLAGKQQALLYGVLAEALSQSNESYLMDKDNESLLGSVAFNNCCSTFESVTRTHKAATVRLYLAQRSAANTIRTEADMDAWCNEVIRLQNNVLSAKVTIEDFLGACFLDFLPKSSEWLTFVVTNTNAETATKPMAIVESAKRHFRTVLETSQQSGISSTHGAVALSVATSLPQENAAPGNTGDDICGGCGGKHRTRDCRRSKDHKCEDCGEFGHFARVCFNHGGKKNPKKGKQPAQQKALEFLVAD